ncbi:MAG TPA: hypothetical protein VN922_05490 [Bacteroidia bacterium]|nr:hypothetical protein [Bacteroidia bacterium]
MPQTPEQRKAYKAAYYQANKVRIDAKNKAWHHANKEYANSKRHQYYLDHKEQEDARMAEWRKQNSDRLKQYWSEWRENNREKIRAQHAAWEARNPEKVLENQRMYYKNNTEKCLAAGKIWRDNNRPRMKFLISEWGRANKDRRAAHFAKRRSTKLQATPFWADHDLIGKIYKDSADKSDLTGVDHEVDHDIPLNNPKVCGLHNQFNLVIRTAEENRIKGNRWCIECQGWPCSCFSS